MVDIAIDCHLKASCQCLEDSLYLMVFILTFCLDVKIDLSAIGE